LYVWTDWTRYRKQCQAIKQQRVEVTDIEMAQMTGTQGISILSRDVVEDDDFPTAEELFASMESRNTTVEASKDCSNAYSTNGEISMSEDSDSKLTLTPRFQLLI
jgi:uncharacterized protein (DUF849 family)